MPQESYENRVRAQNRAIAPKKWAQKIFEFSKF
jgi:hypothetical protein